MVLVLCLPLARNPTNKAKYMILEYTFQLETETLLIFFMGVYITSSKLEAVFSFRFFLISSPFYLPYSKRLCLGKGAGKKQNFLILNVNGVWNTQIPILRVPLAYHIRPPPMELYKASYRESTKLLLLFVYLTINL